MPHKVFFSVGSASTPAQEEFIKLVENYLESSGLTPQCVGRSVIRNQQPLKSVNECMHDCSGTLILAFERTHILQGTEKRGSPDAINLNNLNLPTVWNQIEAAMTYTLGKPLLVLAEKGLKSEGLLEKKYDWYVKDIILDRSILTDPEFLGVFNDWKKSIEQYEAMKKETPIQNVADASALTIGQIVKGLRPAQLWALVITIVTALSTVAVTAFKLGTTIPK